MRRLLLPILLGAYLLLLTVNVVLPFVFASRLQADTVANVKDLLLATSGVLQGLVGLVGIAVGYYFRAAQEK